MVLPLSILAFFQQNNAINMRKYRRFWASITILCKYSWYFPLSVTKSMSPNTPILTRWQYIVMPGPYLRNFAAKRTCYNLRAAFPAGFLRGRLARLSSRKPWLVPRSRSAAGSGDFLAGTAWGGFRSSAARKPWCRCRCPSTRCPSGEQTWTTQRPLCTNLWLPVRVEKSWNKR